MTGSLSSPWYSQQDTYMNLSSWRKASPSSVWCSVRKWPPQDSARSKASCAINVPISIKSATRNAFSNSVFKLSALPGMNTLLQNSFFKSFSIWIASCKPFASRAIPICSHMIWPSLRWIVSTVSLPLTFINFWIRSLMAFSASTNSGRSVLKRGTWIWSDK